MSFALLYYLVRFLLDVLLSRRTSELRLQAEVFALRHQLQRPPTPGAPFTLATC